MRFNRLRIATQLSLLITATVVLAVAVVGGLSALNLRQGFNDYRQIRDEEQLNRLVALIEQRSENDPMLGWLRDDPDPMRRLMDTFEGRPPRGPRPPQANDSAHPDQPPGPRPPRAPEGRRGNFGERLFLRDADGRRLLGRSAPEQVKKTIRAIKVQGQEVAFVELGAEPELAGVDALFLQFQYQRLAWAALGTILMGMLAAWAMAARWSGPLRTLQRATRDIARGRSTKPLEPTGALEIAQLMEDVNTMTTALARLEATRREWIAQISHELRTPLSVLLGEMEAIEDGARQATPQVMASLREEVLQLNRLVGDLHTLSVADLGGMRCHFSDGEAHAHLRRVAERFASKAEQQGLVLLLPPADMPAIAAHWDWGRIEQMLGNLLTNSLRYTDAPGSIAVDWKSDGRLLTLTVDDSAPGVSAADMKVLFEPLFRADRARQRGTEHGSGLGLSIVRSIVKAHQGTVSTGPSPRGGLQMVVHLPLDAKGKST
jgi:two-component system sensor histidine kinase BaeS